MSTLPDTNELEFSKIQEIANSETDRPVFMLNLNKYFDRSGFINRDEKYNEYIKVFMQFCTKLVERCYGGHLFMTKWLGSKI